MAENKIYDLEFEVPKEFGFVISRFISSLFMLPKAGKSFVLKNTSNVIHEEILAYLETVHPFRLFYPYLPNLIGVLDYERTLEQSTAVYNYVDDFAIYINFIHNTNNTRILVGEEFKLYLIKNGKMELIPTPKHLGKTFFYKLDKVSEDKKTPIVIEAMAFSNWTQITHNFLIEEFDKIFGKEVNLAHIEYNNRAPFFTNYLKPVLYSYCKRRPNEDLADLVIKLPVYKFNSDKETRELLDWIFDQLKIIVSERIELIRNILDELFEGAVIDLSVTKTKQEVMMVGFLQYCGCDVYLNSTNIINKKITEKDLMNFKTDFLKLLDNLTSTFSKIKIEWN